jgi:hypothetical protein
VALLDAPQNTRVFEQLDGLLTVTSLFKSRETGREVKFRLTEFLYFYLTPETPSIPRADGRGGGNAAPSGLLQRREGGLAKAFGAGGGGAKKEAGKGGGGGSGEVLSVEEKKLFVDRYLPGVVDELLKDLDTYKPFGGVLS